MPLFMPDEELARLSSDAASLVAERADEYIRKLYAELDSVRAKADAASITAEQTCSLLEQKYLSLSKDFSLLESQNAQLQSDFDDRLAELAESQAQKHQLHLQSVCDCAFMWVFFFSVFLDLTEMFALMQIEKDGEVERLTTEMSELHKSKRQLMELLEHKDSEISEKNSTIKSYLEKIVSEAYLFLLILFCFHRLNFTLVPFLRLSLQTLVRKRSLDLLKLAQNWHVPKLCAAVYLRSDNFQM